MTANEALEHGDLFALVGASPDELRYSHEVLVALRSAGYRVLPVNPKYDSIDGAACYPSLSALPATPDVVVLVLAPANAERSIPDVARAGVRNVWLPPGTASPRLTALAHQLGLDVVADECPVGTLKRRGPRQRTSAPAEE